MMDWPQDRPVDKRTKLQHCTQYFLHIVRRGTARFGVFPSKTMGGLAKSRDAQATQ
jgi:hypothetical protein